MKRSTAKAAPRNGTSGKKHLGRRLRTLTAAAFILMTCAGLIWHTGWGTLSSFGIGSIAQVCPLGALEAMLADRTFLPQAFFGLLVVAAAAAAFGRICCGWVCPVPLLRRIAGVSEEKAHKHETKAEVSALQAAKANACGPSVAGCAPSACGACPAPASGAPGQASGEARGQDKADARGPSSGPFWVLGGALASSAVFGFPVFCLICPVGLTFALVIALWRLFEFNEPSLSIVFFAGFLMLEVSCCGAGAMPFARSAP